MHLRGLLPQKAGTETEKLHSAFYTMLHCFTLSEWNRPVSDLQPLNDAVLLWTHPHLLHWGKKKKNYLLISNNSRSYWRTSVWKGRLLHDSVKAHDWGWWLVLWGCHWALLRFLTQLKLANNSILLWSTLHHISWRTHQICKSELQVLNVHLC